MRNYSTIIILALCLIFAFCKKEKESERLPSTYSVNMTDAPGPYDQVNIDLQAVELTGNGKTVMLNATPGIYNLLDFANGVDTLIATGGITLEKVQQIRLILGPNNSVMVDSVLHPLTIPSGAESGLKLQVHHDLQPGVAYSVLLDFDAYHSIIQEGNGDYKLKPVIRTVEAAISGAIQGTLSVPNVAAVITASSGTSAYSTIPASSGAFLIKGVQAGTYTVTVLPAAPHSSATVNSVSVTTGVTTQVGVINL